MYKIRQGKVGKPPKLRFHPGEYFKEKKTDNIYVCVFAFRLEDDPSIWYFNLEERTDFKEPVTSMSQICSAISPSIQWKDRIQYKPFRNSLDTFGFCNDYHHGDGLIAVSTKRMLNDFIKISSGEIIDMPLKV